MTGNKILDTNFSQTDAPKVSQYADIELSLKERELLSLPPDHQLHPNVEINEIEVEIEKTLIKANWQEIRTERESEQQKTQKESDSSPPKVLENEFTLANLRATDLKRNKRVVIPSYFDEEEESRRIVLKHELIKVAEKYKKEKCNKKGKPQIVTLMTKRKKL